MWPLPGFDALPTAFGSTLKFVRATVAVTFLPVFAFGLGVLNLTAIFGVSSFCAVGFGVFEELLLLESLPHAANATAATATVAMERAGRVKCSSVFGDLCASATWRVAPTADWRI